MTFIIYDFNGFNQVLCGFLGSKWLEKGLKRPLSAPFGAPKGSQGSSRSRTLPSSEPLAQSRASGLKARACRGPRRTESAPLRLESGRKRLRNPGKSLKKHQKTLENHRKSSKIPWKICRTRARGPGRSVHPSALSDPTSSLESLYNDQSRPRCAPSCGIASSPETALKKHVSSLSPPFFHMFPFIFLYFLYIT